MAWTDHQHVIGLIALSCDNSGDEDISFDKYHNKGNDQIEKWNHYANRLAK